MYNTRYLPESFEQCGPEKTILRIFHEIVLTKKFAAEYIAIFASMCNENREMRLQ